MSRLILLDSGIVGFVSHPRMSSRALACLQWLDQLTMHGDLVRVPAIADYEVRRELLRAEKAKGLARLDELVDQLGYLPLPSDGFRHAAQLWAEARKLGQPTAADLSLDGDVILAAHAQISAIEFSLPVIIATDNVGHLSRYCDARRWEEIQPSI